MKMKSKDVRRNSGASGAGARMFCPAALAVALALAGCGGAGEQANKMTSFSTTESAASKAELFSLPADQMAHIQIYTVAQAPLVRTLRLSGAVAYNDFLTTPVITQVGGPVSRIVVTPGEHVTAGQPLLYVASPDYSLTRSAYIKARDAFQLADKFYKRAQDLYAHKAIAQADLEQAESNRTQAEADLQSSEQAIRVLGIRESGERRDQSAIRGIAAAGAAGGRSGGAALLAGAIAAGGRNAVLHAFGHEQRVGARQHLPERYRLRACRRGCDDR